MRLLVTSSREFVFPTIIRKALLRVEFEACESGLITPGEPRYEITLVHGAARGGDSIAAGIAANLGWTVQPYRVTSEQWRASRGAGYARNAEMVNDGSDFFLAFLLRCSDPKCRIKRLHETHGATHCLGLARAAGIPRRVYRLPYR